MLTSEFCKDSADNDVKGKQIAWGKRSYYTVCLASLPASAEFKVELDYEFSLLDESFN